MSQSQQELMLLKELPLKREVTRTTQDSSRSN